MSEMSLPLTVLLVTVLWSGALAKLLRFPDFCATVVAYEIIPVALTALFAVAFILAEVAAGVLMLVPGLRVMGALGAAALLVMASGAILVNLLRGRVDVSCGCGALSDGGEGLSWWMLVRNGVLIAVALAVVRAGASAPAASSVLRLLGAVAIGSILVLVYYAANQVIVTHVRMDARQGVEE